MEVKNQGREITSICVVWLVYTPINNLASSLATMTKVVFEDKVSLGALAVERFCLLLQGEELSAGAKQVSESGV